MIGGGDGSQIGPVHRICAALDGQYSMVAPVRSMPTLRRAATSRSGWASHPTAPMATGATCWRARRTAPTELDLVTVATPNATHYEITKAFLEAGINVLCEKPHDDDRRRGGGPRAPPRARTGAICAVNYGYTRLSIGAPHARMVARGDLGKVSAHRRRIRARLSCRCRRCRQSAHALAL